MSKRKSKKFIRISKSCSQRKRAKQIEFLESSLAELQQELLDASSNPSTILQRSISRFHARLQSLKRHHLQVIQGTH